MVQYVQIFMFQREEIKVGKLVTENFLCKTEDKQVIKNHTPGKINTAKLFSHVTILLRYTYLPAYSMVEVCPFICFSRSY